jgi:hypothetical protein
MHVALVVPKSSGNGSWYVAVVAAATSDWPKPFTFADGGQDVPGPAQSQTPQE